MFCHLGWPYSCYSAFYTICGRTSLCTRVLHGNEIIIIPNQGKQSVTHSFAAVQKLAEIEDMYATAISKLLRSPCYTFKQNFLRQLMRNGDIEEFG